MGHLIHRQILELKFASQQQAQHWSPRFSELNRRIILPELDRLFSELTPQQALRIQRLEVDLGRLRPDHLEQDLLASLRQQVAEALHPYLQTATQVDATAEVKPALASDHNQLPSEEKGQKLDEDALAELFEQFLQTGQLPWWLARELIPQLDRLYLQFWHRAPERARQLVAEAIAGPVGLIRFVEQFSNASHQLTLQELLPPIPGVLLVDLRKLAVYLLARQGFGLQARVVSYKLVYGLITSSDPRQLEQPLALARQFFFTLAQVSGIPAAKLREEVDATVARLRLNSATRAVLAELLRQASATQEAPADRSRIVLPDDEKGLAAARALTADEELEVYIENAGLVLLWPHFKELLQQLDLLERLDDGQLRPKFEAVLLLQQLVSGQPAAPESLLPLNKLLCGLPLSTPVPRRCRRRPQWDAQVEKLLTAVIRQWAVLKNTSVDGLRQSFLQREGILREQGEGWALQVERKAHDILLERIPWGFAMIRLSWMPRPLLVEW